MHGDAHLLRAQRDGDRASDAVPRAGHQRRPVIQLHGVNPVKGGCISLRGAIADACVLPLEPSLRHAHHAERARAFGRAVPIRSAARHQSEEIDERGEARDVFGRMARVTNFDAVDARSRERLDALARPGLRRMRENGETARAVDRRDRVRRG